jgi:peptidoglycan/xylan/chitin deacetylase (PgdA/CDA1 family)
VKRILALTLSLGVRIADAVNGAARRWAGKRRPRQGVVLYYHAITARERPRFAWQMDELLHLASPFCAGAPDTMTGEGLNVAVTFDDGFLSVVENALPELSERGIPFTMFVPSGCLGERPSWIHDPNHPSWDEQVLSEKELRALASHPLATVGSHSITHPNLPKIDLAAAERELRESREQLEAVVATPIDQFSFPHGAHNDTLLASARQAGYRLVFTVEPTTVTPSRHPFAVGRVAADPGDWRIEFRLKIAGAYRWRYAFHRLRRSL